MISRCPSCGAQVKEEERLCPSCGWDFVARKRAAKPGAGAPPGAKPPSAGPPPGAPPRPPVPGAPPPVPGAKPPGAAPPAGGFALPPARNLNEAPGEPNLGLKPLPKVAPKREEPAGPDENPFTLPTARPPAAAGALPPAKDVPKPAPGAPAPEKPAPEKPAAPPAKEGFGARFLRSLRRESAPEAKPEAPPPAPAEPEEQGYSLPPARIVPGEEEAAPVAPPAPAAGRSAPGVGELPSIVPAEPEPAPAPEPEPAPAPAPEPVAEEPVFEAPPPPEPAAPARASDPILDDPLADPLAGAEPPRTEIRAGPRPARRPAPEPAPAPAPEPAPRRRPAAPAQSAPPPTQTPAPAGARNSPVYIAAIAGAALGTVSVLAVYLLLRGDSTSSARPSGENPFARGSAVPAGAVNPAAVPAPAPAPAAAPEVPSPAVTPAPAPVSPAPVIGNPDAPLPKTIGAPVVQGGPVAAAPPPPPVAAPKPAAPAEDARPAATFASAPRVVVANEPPPAKPKPKAKPAPAEDEEEAPAPAARSPRARSAAEPAAPRKPKGPAWTFEGVVFDLLTARGVFAAKLIFLDPDGNQVGAVETGPGGRYKATVPPLGAGGYSMKVAHQDYTERYIDEGDATSSLREATPEERKILMQAASRNLPWKGDLKKTVHRDLALVPRSPEEP